MLTLEPIENYEEITNRENIENGRQHYQLFNVEQEIFNELEPIENYEDFCNLNNLANSDFCSRSKIHSTSTSNIFNDFYAAYKRDVNNFVADPYSGLTTLYTTRLWYLFGLFLFFFASNPFQPPFPNVPVIFTLF